jgi:hypothetical protein
VRIISVGSSRRSGHDGRLMLAKYVRPCSKGQKNEFRDAEAIAIALPDLSASPQQSAFFAERDGLLRGRFEIRGHVCCCLVQRRV